MSRLQIWSQLARQQVKFKIFLSFMTFWGFQTMLITNLTFVFFIRPSGGPGWSQGCHIVDICDTIDIGYDSCRFRRELPEFTKIMPHSHKSGTFMLSKIVLFFFCTTKGTQVNPKQEPYIRVHTTRQGLSKLPS